MSRQRSPSATPPQPPRLARALLRQALPDDSFGDSVMGDLHEELLERVERAGGRTARARLWYTAEALRIALAEPLRRLVARASDASRAQRRPAGDALQGDLRAALRALAKRPAHTAVALLSLAIGIGSTVAVFSVANALFLRPVPGVHDTSRAVEIGRTTDGRGFDTMSYADIADIRNEVDAFEHVVEWEAGLFRLSVDGRGEQVQGYYVAPGYFELLGLRPALGRFLLPEEAAGVGAHPVVVVTHRFWQERLGGDADALGAKIELNRETHEVVGVAPPAFQGHMFAVRGSVFLPITQHPRVVASPEVLTTRGNVSPAALGLLREGVTVAAADAAARAVFLRLAAEYPETNGRFGARVIPLGPLPGFGRGPVAGFVLLLGALVSLVLLATCANVAGMLLAQAAARERELAIRLSLGCGRARLVRQLLAESTLLAGAGGVLGVLGASWALRAIDVSRLGLPVDVSFDLSPDLRVMAFALGVSLFAALVFGTTPALHSARTDLVRALHQGAATVGGRRARLRRAFVGAEVALAFLLAVVAGLFVRSLQAAGDIHKGFDPEGVAITSLDLDLEGYEGAEAAELLRGIHERVRAIPGVDHAAFSIDLPLDMSAHHTGIVPDTVSPEAIDDPESASSADFNLVTHEYFDTLRIAVQRGRAFEATDLRGGSRVAIVSRGLAERVWGEDDPLGRTFRMPGRSEYPYTVVGVADDVKNQMLMERSRPFLYLPLDETALGGEQRLSLSVRSGGDLDALAGPIRQAILDTEPSLALVPVTTLARYVGIGTLPQKIGAGVASSLGVVALFLAALGLYGVVAVLVAERRHEIGVRMALGEGRHALVRRFVRGTLRLALPGLLVGGLLALGLGQAIRSFLLGVDPLDPVALGLVAVGVLGVVAVAGWLPARRAARLDPVEALRRD
ncbi:MAG TPA: ADOP family duplicated permease [Thermoanaerobaculia bacterium]|nr:ADOP family duplicated permease [Thermoanaerobaculia bacterium]